MAVIKSSRAEDLFEQLDAENIWEGHLIDPGNLYERGSGYGYWVPFPTWWRRFAFRVLEPRDIAVYLYVCSYMSTQLSSRPTIKTISSDMGYSNRHGVTDSLERLVERGFLVRQKMPSVVLRDNRHPRYVYQRPSMAFTLCTLLSQFLINGYLQPTTKTMRRGQDRLPGQIEARLWKPLIEPLKALIGNDAFAEWAKAPNESQKRQILITYLDSAVNTMRAEAKASSKTSR